MHQDPITNIFDHNANHQSRKEDDELLNFSELFDESLTAIKQKSLRLPFISQNDSMDCGPACLAMLCKYYGIPLGISFWREELSTDKSGTTLYDISTIAEKYGFETHGILTHDLEQIDKIYFPFIALKNYHYFLIYKIENGIVTYADPSIGIKKQSLSDFKTEFNGHILLIKPTSSTFVNRPQEKQSKTLLKTIKSAKNELISIFLFSVFLVTIGCSFPILTQILIDDVIASKDNNFLISIVLIGVCLAGAFASLSWIRSYFINYLSYKIDLLSHSFFIKKLFSLPYGYFAKRHLGDFTKRIYELNEVSHFVAKDLIGMSIDLIMAAAYLIAISFYSFDMFLMVIFAAPLVLLLSIFTSRRLTKEYSEYFEKSAKLEGMVADLIRGILTIKSKSAEDVMRWKFEEMKTQSLSARFNYQSTSAWLWSGSNFVEQSLRFSFVGLAVYLGIKGLLTPGEIIATTILCDRALAPFKNFAISWSELAKLKTVISRLNDVMNSKSEVSSQEQSNTKVIRGDIEFKDVWFRFGGEASEWILKGISFNIKAGEHVSIVGPSGSGKSTIALLILGLYKPQKGEIYIDGINVKTFDLQNLRSQIGLIGSHFQLFGGKVSENVAFGEIDPDIDKVKKSLKMAQLTDCISEKPGGINFTIPHGGIGFSSGEKQKFAIAQLFHNQYSIIISDEATANLDGISEREVLHQLDLVTENRTTIQISHKILPVMKTAKTIVLSKGKIVEFGDPRDLIVSNGLFSRIFTEHPFRKSNEH